MGLDIFSNGFLIFFDEPPGCCKSIIREWQISDIRQKIKPFFLRHDARRWTEQSPLYPSCLQGDQAVGRAADNDDGNILVGIKPQLAQSKPARSDGRSAETGDPEDSPLELFRGPGLGLSH